MQHSLSLQEVQQLVEKLEVYNITTLYDVQHNRVRALDVTIIDNEDKVYLEPFSGYIMHTSTLDSKKMFFETCVLGKIIDGQVQELNDEDKRVVTEEMELTFASTK